MLHLANYYLLHFAQTLTNCNPGEVDSDGKPKACTTNLPELQASPGNVTLFVQIIFAIIGTMAVFYIIIAGFRFITAQDEPQAISKARNTILYAVIGLIIAIFAEVLVTFVIKKI